MLVARAPLKLAALPAGLAVAAVGWFASGAMNPPAEIAQLQARLDAARPLLRFAPPTTPAMLGAIAQSRPLFDLGSRPSTSEPTLELQGLSLGAGGKAALIAVDATTPVWLSVGESHSGVTLRRVDASSALVETVSGDHSLRLGEGHAAGASTAPPTTAGSAAVPATLPSTVR